MRRPVIGVRGRALDVLLFLVAAATAILLYRPDTNAPFEIIDFSETLPFLTDGQDFGERFRGLAGYYLEHGRAAFALSAGLAAKWTVFEWWTPGWQWTRYVVGVGVVVLAWQLLRALGANRAGASLGASLFVVSETVAPGWLRPSVNEPFATLLLLAASVIACGYQSTTRPQRLAVVIAVLLAGMIVVKETLVVATFFPVAIALCRRPDGLLAAPERSRRNVVLVASSVAAIAVAAVPVLWAITQTAPDGYARQFGANESLLSNAIFGVLPALVPFTPVSQPPGWAATLADVGWLVLLMAGLRVSPGSLEVQRSTRVLLLIAVALPLARLIVYLPWPLQFPYYSIPFLVGVAVLSSLGMTRLTGSDRGLRIVAVFCAAVVFVYAASQAHAQAGRYFALRHLTYSLVSDLHALGQSAGIRRIVLAVPYVKSQAWTGLGPTLSRFASATGQPLPVIEEVTCGDGVALIPAVPTGTALVSFRHHCQLPVDLSAMPSQLVRRVDFTALRLVTDTLRAQIVVGAQ